MRLRVRSLALLSGLRIPCCHELWCRSQRQLGSYVAVAVAGSCSSDSTPSLGTSHMLQERPKKWQKDKKKRSPQIPNAGGGVEKRECKLVQPLWRSVWRYLRNLYIEVPYDPAIPLLGIHLDKTFLKKSHAPACSLQLYYQ